MDEDGKDADAIEGTQMKRALSLSALVFVLIEINRMQAALGWKLIGHFVWVTFLAGYGVQSLVGDLYAKFKGARR